MKSLEQRLRALEDRNGIEELRATYCFLVDDGKFDELVERCFTDDARCDFRDARGAIAPLVSTGHTEIRAFFGQVVAALLGDMSHTVHNHRIVVDGVWRFAERVAVIGHMAPLAEGWVRQRLLRALTGA